MIVVAVLALVASYFFKYTEAEILGFALLICVIAAWFAVRYRAPVEVTRVVSPARVEEGQGCAGVLTVTNLSSKWSRPMDATEQLGPEVLHLALPSIAGGDTHIESYTLPTNHRGCYTVGPLRIGHTDPFHLVSATQEDTAEQTLWVHPKTYRVRPIPTGRADDIEGPAARTAPRGGVAFHSLREYVPGDDPRLIHWRSTARLGKMMVKHTVVTNEPRLLIVLDTSADPYTPESFEDAVRVAASLMKAGLDQHYPTQLRTTGGIDASIDQSGLGLNEVMDKLAAVKMSKDDEGLPAMGKMAHRREHGVALGVVTGQPTPERASIVGAVSDRFMMVSLIQVGEKYGRPGIGLSGVFGVSANDAEEFVRIWKTRVG
ncbi:MAG TPA: DUF58 domain-containing protein [Acidimicrobiales bacterium]|nr:DUF58 domain-containing protein [Acidimicrobiales bacterium]